MPTMSWSALGRVPSIWRSKASAGGQLEQPSEVKSSTRITFGKGAGAADAVDCADIVTTYESKTVAMPAVSRIM